jgi:N-acylglucosamine-6-phosphate 2-epimerase
MNRFKQIIPRGLIVSCQAYKGDPLFGSETMAAMSRAAEIGGAVAIRANSPSDIMAIRQSISIPIIGINKIKFPLSDVYITPTKEAAEEINNAGIDVIAIDATPRVRPGGVLLTELVEYIHDILRKPIMGDVSCLEDALLAESLNIDAVSTTLAGYTVHGRPAKEDPDIEFVSELVNKLKIPTIAEGRFRDTEQVARVINIGAYAVVVGDAITRPENITRRFIQAINKIQRERE